MTNLPSGVKLETEPWTFFRTINIVDDTNVLGAAAIASQRLGQVRGTFFSWTSEFSLHDPADDREISKIINPHMLAFWDVSQDIYDCKGRLLGTLEIPWDFTSVMANMFSNTYVTHKVYDSEHAHVADLVHESITEDKALYLGSLQHFIYLRDTAGNPLVSMRNPSGGWTLPPIFGESFNVQIVTQSMNAANSPLAMSPEFLSVVFANALAGQSRLGPYVGLIAYPALILIFGACMVSYCLGRCSPFAFCCGICGSKKEEPETPAVEEKEALIEQKEDKRNVWGCCSRGRTVIPK